MPGQGIGDWSESQLIRFIQSILARKSITVTEAQLALSDISLADTSVNKHGFCPKLPNDATKFLNGAGIWSIPSRTESDWVYVGGGGGAPAFKNGWHNLGGSVVPMRYRLLPEFDIPSNQHGIEIQGAIAGGAASTVIFTLPFTIDYDLHLTASDNSGGFVVFTVKQSGDVVYGFV